MLPEERARGWDGSLQTRHYLQSAPNAGQNLRHIAEVDGQWVALLVFSGAAPHTKARESEIGWTPRQRARRLLLTTKQQSAGSLSGGPADSRSRVL